MAHIPNITTGLAYLPFNNVTCRGVADDPIRRRVLRATPHPFDSALVLCGFNWILRIE